MSGKSSKFQVVTVTLNPAIDQTVTVPGFSPGKVNRAAYAYAGPGGKGVNVASALADYGCNVAVTGIMGAGNSILFDQLFEHKRIENCFVRIEGDTRIGIKIIDPALGETTDINLPGLSPCAADLNRLREQIDILDAGWFVFGGSVPSGVDPSIYAALITSLKARGCKVVLDTSGEPLRAGIEALPHIIKPNIHELEALTGRSLPTISEVTEAARELNGCGIGLVAVSMGGEGACFVTADTVIIARTPAVEVKSTVGAGDAMVAGIVAAQLDGLPVRECARLATAFSLDLLACGKSGLSSRSAIGEWMKKIDIQ